MQPNSVGISGNHSVANNRGAFAKLWRSSRGNVSLAPKRQGVVTQAGLFKVSHAVPVPLSKAQFSKARQSEWRSLDLPDSDKEAMRQLLMSGNGIVEVLRQAEKKGQKAQLVIYRPKEEGNDSEAKILQEIEAPVSPLIKRATHPLSYAAQAIDTLLADLPRHVPPAFIFRLLNPAYQFKTKETDPKRFSEAERQAHWTEVPTQIWRNFKTKKADDESVLELSEAEHQALSMNAYPRFLSLGGTRAEDNYPVQLMRMLDTVQTALNRENDPAIQHSQKGEKAKLGVVFYDLKGISAIHDLSELYPGLKKEVTIDRLA